MLVAAHTAADHSGSWLLSEGVPLVVKMLFTVAAATLTLVYLYRQAKSALGGF